MGHMSAVAHALRVALPELLADRELITVTGQNDCRRDRIYQTEMDVEHRAGREGAEVAEQVFSSGAPRIGRRRWAGGTSRVQTRLHAE
jgi:hypothetical protein